MPMLRLSILLVVLLAGCVSGPPLENPNLVGMLPRENPLFVPQGQDPQQYQRVYDVVYDLAQQHFDIAASNMYAGEILGVPRISAGIFDAFRYGEYDGYELWQSTAQSIRRRLHIQIIPAEVGGYFVSVKVYKELEDPGVLVNPLLQRRLRPEDPTNTQGVSPSWNTGLHWIDLGRDIRLEDAIIAKLKERL
jgi:hypothetical protein